MAACERNPEFGVEFLGASLQGLMFSWLILVQARTERFDIVEATVERALRWDRQRGELENEALMSGDSMGALALYAGESVRPLAMARRGLALAVELAIPIARCSSLRGCAICLHVSGDSAGATELFLQWREETRSHQVDLEYAPLALSVMAQAQAATGQAEVALQTATEALEQVTDAGSNLLLPDVYHGLAIVHLALGNLDEADDALDHMDTAVRAIGAVNLAPLVLRSRAAVLAKRGDAQGSAKLLSAALAGFEECGATGHARALREAGVV